MNLPIATHPPVPRKVPSFWLGVFAAAPFFTLAACLLWMALKSPVEVEPAKPLQPRRGNLLVSGGQQQVREARDVSPRAAPPTPAAAPKASTLTSPFDHFVEPAAAKHGIPADLVRAVIRVESNNNPHAVSRVGARGLMQLMPATAKSLNVNNSFDAEQNINGGAKYLKQLSDQFDGDLVKTVAAYNAGPAAVMRYGGKVPPYEETQAYVKRVLGFYGRSSQEEPAVSQVVDDPASFLVWPAPGVISRRLSLKRDAKETGVELRVASAASIRSASEGRVVAVLKQRDGTKSVTVKHDDRYSTTYADLAVVLVDVNDVVAAGDSIGNAAVKAGRNYSLIRFDLREDDKPRDPVDFRWRGVAKSL